MKSKTKLLFIIGLLVVIGFFAFYHNRVQSGGFPPQLTLFGDDIKRNGGSDDDYDSLVIIHVKAQSTQEEEGWILDRKSVV